MPVDGPLKKRTAVRTRRYVQDHRYAGLTGSISQPVTEFTYNRKRQRPLPLPNLLKVRPPLGMGMAQWNGDFCAEHPPHDRPNTTHVRRAFVPLPNNK